MLLQPRVIFGVVVLASLVLAPSSAASCVPMTAAQQRAARRAAVPVDGGLGRQAAGGSERVQAMAGERVRGDIVPQVAALGTVGEQVSDHLAQLLLRSRDLLIAMQERRELRVVVRV